MQQNPPTLFNREVKNFSKTIEELTYNDVARTLFFTRIASLQLRALSRSQIISDGIRNMIYYTLDTIRKCDYRMVSAIGKDREALLWKELKKDKVYDIGNLVESMMIISNDESHSTYEEQLGLVTTWIEAITKMQKKNRKVDIRKYAAMIQFMLEEMKAEAEGGITSVVYDSQTNELNFKLVQPNSNVPVQPTITK